MIPILDCAQFLKRFLEKELIFNRIYFKAAFSIWREIIFEQSSTWIMKKM